MKKILIFLLLIPAVLSAQTKLTYTTAEVQTLLDNVDGYYFADDYATLALADAAAVAAGKGLIISTPFTITDNITLSSPLTITKGGLLTVSSNKQLTILGSLTAGLYQIFAVTDSVVFGPSTVKEIYPQWYGALGDANNDDYPAIRKALIASMNLCPVTLPTGAYKITSPLTILSNTTLRGSGRNFGTTIYPTGCAAFNINGTPVVGGWVFRIEISDMLVALTNASATNAVTINAAYNVKLKNIFFYDQPAGVTNGITVTSSNDIITDGVILYNTASTGKAYNINGTPSPVNMRIIDSDIENYYIGIGVYNAVSLDVFYPYMERETVGIDYQGTNGMTNIYGGIISTVNGYGVTVAGNNLNVYGTDIDPYQAAVRGGPGIMTIGTEGFTNVNFYNIPRIANEGFMYSANNLLTANTYPSSVTDTTNSTPIYRKTLDFYKSVHDNTATDLYRFQNLSLYMKCRLTLHGVLGTCYLEKIYDFMISGDTGYSAINITDILDTSGGNYTAVMTVALSAGAGNVTVSVTVDTQGALGNGQDFPLYGQLEIVGSDNGVGGIYLQ